LHETENGLFRLGGQLAALQALLLFSRFAMTDPPLVGHYQFVFGNGPRCQFELINGELRLALARPLRPHAPREMFQVFQLLTVHEFVVLLLATQCL
jgi:hypothetical protein